MGLWSIGMASPRRISGSLLLAIISGIVPKCFGIDMHEYQAGSRDTTQSLLAVLRMLPPRLRVASEYL